MTEFTLGINTCFAPKRWAEPAEWSRITSEELGLKSIQFTFDLMDPRAKAGAVDVYIGQTLEACAKHGIRIHSTFTGLIPYIGNLLMHPEKAFREDAKDWFKSAIDATAKMKVAHTGGFFGALSMKDARDPVRKAERLASWQADLQEIAAYAKDKGLESLLVEHMAVWREPPTSIDEAVALASLKTAVPLRITIDLGHMVVKGRAGQDLDPYAWLTKVSPHAGSIHLQQSDAQYDRHQPFTPETNKAGRIDPKRAVEAIRASGVKQAALFFEIFHAFEEDEARVLEDLRMSVKQWKDAIA
jgi:sugar phosphate isomerase/epimerase